MSLTLDSLVGSEREEKLTWMKGADISGLSCLRETTGPMRIVGAGGGERTKILAAIQGHPEVKRAILSLPLPTSLSASTVSNFCPLPLCS